MAEDMRPYEPTARHLRRLAAEGAGPHSHLLRAAAVAFVGCAIALWAALAGSAVFTHALRACLAAASPPTVHAARYALHLVGWPLLAAAVAVAAFAGVAAWLADGVLAGFAASWRRRSRPGPPPPAQALSHWLWGWCAALLVICVASLAIAWTFAQGLGAADESRLAAIATGAGAWIMLIAALAAAVDALVAHVRFRARARMTRAEYLEDQRHERGPWLTAWRRSARLRRRRP